MNFEAHRLIAAIIFACLLAPLGSVFWVLTRVPPTPPAKLRADLEESLRAEINRQAAQNGDDSGPTRITEIVTEQIGIRWFPWFALYPRPWIGWVGLGSLAIAVACLAVSLYVPSSGKLVGAATLEGAGAEPKIEIRME